MSWGTGLSAFASAFSTGYQLSLQGAESEMGQALWDTQNEAAKLDIEHSREEFPLKLEQTRSAIDYNKALTTSSADTNRRENEMQPGRIEQQNATLDATRVGTANAIDTNRRAEDLHGIAVDQAKADVDTTLLSNDEQRTKNRVTQGALPEGNGLSRNTNDALDAAFGPGSPTYVPINGGSSGGGTIPDSYYASIRTAESGGNDRAANPNSSAYGRYQFIDSTWQQLAKQHPELGLTRDGRSDPAQQERAIRALTQDNANALKSAGVQVDGGSLYAAHFLGPEGAKRAYSTDPRASMSSIVGRQVIEANPFLATMSVGEFQQWAAKKGGGSAGASTPAPAKSSMASAPTIDADQSQVAEGIKLGLQRLSSDLLGNDVSTDFALPPENTDEAIQRLYLGDGAGEPEMVTRVLNSVDPEGIYPTGVRINMAIGQIMASSMPTNAKAEAVKELQQSGFMEFGKWATLAEKAANAGDIDGQMQAAIQAYNTIPNDEIITAVDYNDKTDRFMLTMRNVSTGKETTQPFLSPQEVAAGALAIQPEMYYDMMARFVAIADANAPSGTNGKGASSGAGGAAAIPVGASFENAVRTGHADPAAMGALPESQVADYNTAVKAGREQNFGGMDAETAKAAATDIVTNVVGKLTSDNVSKMHGAPAPTAAGHNLPTSGSLQGLVQAFQDPRFSDKVSRVLTTYLQRADAVAPAVLTDIIADSMVPGGGNWGVTPIDGESVLVTSKTGDERYILPVALANSIRDIQASALEGEIQAWGERDAASIAPRARSSKAADARRRDADEHQRNAGPSAIPGGALPGITRPKIEMPTGTGLDYTGGMSAIPMLDRRQ